MNDTKKDRRLMHLLLSLALVFWGGVIAGIFNLVIVAIAATVYCILGTGIMIWVWRTKATQKRWIMLWGIALVVFLIPIICLFF